MPSIYRILVFLFFPLLAVHAFFLSPPSSRSSFGQDKKRSITIEKNKGALLREIAKANKNTGSSNRGSILDAIEDLENCTDSRIAISSLDGEWSLVYSSQVKSTRDADTLIDKISAVLYKIFFKVAPFLAGGQDSGSAASYFVKSSNKQYIDVTKGTVNNTVLLKFSDKLTSKITVDGLISPIKTSEKSNDVSTRVVFTDFALQVWDKVPSFRIPLPRPSGILVTTFCDLDLRVSRGGRGGVFVAKRL